MKVMEFIKKKKVTNSYDGLVGGIIRERKKRVLFLFPGELKDYSNL
jgi:hypothetical protein